jgi:hypothetical protein
LKPRRTGFQLKIAVFERLRVAAIERFDPTGKIAPRLGLKVQDFLPTNG